MLGALVGLTAEARLLRKVLPEAPIAVSGATLDGARRALATLRAAGATELLSFGCAAGLSPAMRPGAILVPERVCVHGRHYTANAALRRRFGADRADVVTAGLLQSDVLVETAREKAALFAESGCVAVDMESGLVAESGLPFAVLRVVCDDAARDLPPVACDVLSAGKISVPRLVGGLLRQPGQIGALMALGREAAVARKSMASFLRGL
ncbi:hypothetical protein NCH01_17940 [Neoasaia chiangmaiensis]|uniref:Uncharacterized protein n=1 Tax=Neoasaia chiangmaiensis TaxID=320497 RepID=A0A1U9KRP0_9PROT|nr:hypothetical protein [Neoasaia chiangmaiensis]AQS88531.1 hypothetical protein A0U93_11950 [Neoasaia chiangmaiensis]GEN15363.1 hypothetical protein NCH01_17940 [Neoasaia chiangmaiensis]